MEEQPKKPRVRLTGKAIYIIAVFIYISIFSSLLPDGAVGLFVILNIIFACALYNAYK